MNRNFFFIMEKERRGDTLGNAKLLSETAQAVQFFIDTSISIGNFNKDSYYDLFFIKKKILGGQELRKQIDSLKVKYPDKVEFFEGAEQTFDPKPAVTSPLPK